MDRIKGILIIGSVFLLILILFLLSILNKKKSSKDLFPLNILRKEKQPSSFTPNFSNLPKPSSSVSSKEYLLSSKTLDKQTAQNFQTFIQKLPLETENYQASFSAMTGKILVTYKNPEGENSFISTLERFGLSNNKSKDFIISISSKEDLEKYQEAEEIIKNFNIERLSKPIPTPTPYKFKTVEEYQEEQQLRASKSLENTLRKIVSILSTPAEYFTPEEKISPPPVPQKTPSPSLRGIVMEVSQKVGVPEGILMGVITIENPAVFYLPEIKVREYSKPNAVWPECKPNVCSATGPMQITTGVDPFGSPSCSKCCPKGKCLDSRGGCPNQWAIYSHAVNTYGGYNRQPNPCNILDNIYAGALKLKTDSKARNPLLWTKEEVFRAARAYHGECTVKFKRLGNRTYCEFIWDYYQSYKNQ